MIDSEDEEDEKEDEEKKKTAHKEEMKVSSNNSINSPPTNNLISKISQKSISITSIQIPKYTQTSRFDRKFDDEKGTKQGEENIGNYDDIDDNSAKSHSSNST